jgi:mevalonate kinase
MTITTRKGAACGKVILLGEHAVVYGVPALAVGIDRGARARATLLERGPSTLHVGRDVRGSAAAWSPLDGWDISVHEDQTDRDLGRAFRAVLDLARDGQKPGSELHVAVEAEADLPPGAGLGCSAALGVAIARAVDPGAAEPHVAARAMAWERVFHGNPSGVDAAVAAMGGCIYFKKGEPIVPLHVRANIVLCVGHSGIASSTKAMVEAVARLRARRPEVVAKAFEGIRALVENAKLALEAGDKFALGRLMDLNQMLLSGLFVSSEEIERMCDVARGAGAMGAKLTGAGGGGCVVALAPNRAGAERVLEAWKSAGFDGFATEVAAPERDAVLGEMAP